MSLHEMCVHRSKKKNNFCIRVRVALFVDENATISSVCDYPKLLLSLNNSPVLGYLNQHAFVLSCSALPKTLPLFSPTPMYSPLTSRQSPSSSSSSFASRPFPPPSLTNVPHEYIVDQLRNFASNYWDRPQTADCTISTSLLSMQGCHLIPSLGSRTCSPSSTTSSP